MPSWITAIEYISTSAQRHTKKNQIKISGNKLTVKVIYREKTIWSSITLCCAKKLIKVATQLMIFATSIIKRLVIETMFLMAEAICFWTYLLGVFYLVVLSNRCWYCNRIERIKSRPVNYLFCNKQNVLSEFHLDF